MTSYPTPTGWAIDDGPLMRCLSCDRPISFGPAGWAHHDPNGCPGLEPSWPAEIPEDAEEDESTPAPPKRRA